MQEVACVRYGGSDLEMINTLDGSHDTLDIIDAPDWFRARARAVGEPIPTEVSPRRDEERP
jgi:hypothetical protein